MTNENNLNMTFFEDNNATLETPELPKEKQKKSHPFLFGLLGGFISASLVLGAYTLIKPTTQTTRQATHTTSVPAQVISSPVEDTPITTAVENIEDAIVSIINYQAGQSSSLFSTKTNEDSQLQEAGTGSGVIYKTDDNAAYVITNNHVIDGAKQLAVQLRDGQKVDAELVGTDALTDLAVLRISKEHVTKVANFANSNDVKVGQTALAIGSPLGTNFASSVTRGIVSAVNRTVGVDSDQDGQDDWYMDAIQTDAAINPGNSGGALVNINGDVIGINSMKISNTAVEGIGFAIPSNQVMTIVTQLEKDGKVSRPFLGIRMVSLQSIPSAQRIGRLNLPDSVTDGVVVSFVQQDSAAAKAGLQRYDVITKWNGEPVTDTLGLRKLLYQQKEGDRVTVEIYRGGQQQTVELTLTSASI